MCFLTDSTNHEDIENIDSLIIDLSTLRAATGNFAEANKLGEGGFGAVYKVVAIPIHLTYPFQLQQVIAYTYVGQPS